MVRYKYVRGVIDFNKVGKSMTVPDQSLSIQEIVRRYVKGIPVDVVQRQGVYIDQDLYDLEAMSRKDFAQKAALAVELLEQCDSMASDVKAEAERLREVRLKAKENEQKEPGTRVKELIVKQSAKKHSSDLDNTMLDDTK